MSNRTHIAKFCQISKPLPLIMPCRKTEKIQGEKIEGVGLKAGVYENRDFRELRRVVLKHKLKSKEGNICL